MNELKKIHKSISDVYLDENKDKGFDSEVTAKMVESAISRRPIEEKREFYKLFVNSLKNLDSDSQWLKEVSSTLQTSYQHAQSKSMEGKIEITTTPERNFDQKVEGPSNSF